MPSAMPYTVPASPPVTDTRLTPAYYFRDTAPGSYVTDLLARCPSVFAVKPTMAADLDRGEDGGRGVIEEGAFVEGRVVVMTGARVEAGARIIGPVLICPDSVVSAGALVRDHTVIGPGCRVGFGAEITRSLLAGHVFAKHPCFIGDSVIGRRVNVGAFCSTTGLRCDRGPITEPSVEEIVVTLDGRRLGTGQTKFGAIIGDEVALPAGTVLSPGTLIGPGTVIFPHNQVGGFLPAGARVR